MKFNLEQRRRMIKDDGEIQGLEKREIIAGYEEWFEGFERELRQKLTDLGDTTIHSMHDNVKWKIAAQSQKGIIEEVLGVEPKIKEETKR